MKYFCGLNMSTKYFFRVGLSTTILIFCVRASTAKSEPVCSKFDYEMKTLEAMLRIEQRVEKMAAEVKTMKHTFSKELEESKELRSSLEFDFERLKSSVESKMVDLKTELENRMVVLAEKSENQRQEIETTLKRLENHTNFLPIAFSVTNPTKALVNGVPTFAEIITNIGGGYNIKTGIFTSPVNGLYHFTFTLASFGSYNIYCRIQQNGKNKVLGQTNADNSYTTAATSVNLLLVKGDTVRIGDCYQWNHVYHKYSSTSFNGVLITRTNLH